MLFILAIITIGFGIARFVVPAEGVIHHDDIFKDMAHIWVGLLFGYAIARTKKAEDISPWWFWNLAITLTAVEVVAFVLRKSS